MKTYDLTYARPVTTVGNVRVGDLRVFSTDQGVYVMPVTEVFRKGKMITITAKNLENPTGLNVRVSQTTHRVSTKTSSALGLVYRPEQNPFAG